MKLSPESSPVSPFDSPPEQDEAPLTGPRNRLAVEADDPRRPDIAYRTVESPIGTLLLAATDRGLVRVAFPVQDHTAVLHQLADSVSPRILHAPARLDDVSAQLDEYFAGRRRHFDVPLDRRLSKGFRREALVQLSDIAYGHTASYAQIAAAAGSPRAVRAVGTACATNPLPLVVPCHRVIRSDGTAGQYAGGAEAKHFLLRLESAAYNLGSD
ncbi:methylated-DNA--[protein]-cysteine S-methyltransferase [Streptomyces sp. 8L]|uniref:methylated-DNA--[protein]-cysteine S-methyltransferase n=1 Tax=Streptomyces sp. 8L TaxID=2877242 RepID=UPI001CD344DB|nr:methylated-DNA--[protein]-cysteine S-methyltransferase [Streptomyces sp. 8L]MCA1217274.1 methylated-DNA--[protein]-cysteine S-methyltransferase [Streptomyces sp. 8L]